MDVLLVHDAASELRRDVCFACFSDIRGWGGGNTAAHGLLGASGRRGLRTLLLGTSTQRHQSATPSPNASQWNVRVASPAVLWRVQSWRVVAQLVRHLRRLPGPRLAFVAVHAYWAVAARRAWPDARVIYFFPCLLSNCLPFTWPRRRPPTWWKRLDFAGMRRAEHLAFAQADLILTPTRAAHDEVRAFHPGARDRLAVCPYGSEPRAIAPGMRAAQRRALGVGSDDFVCLAAGVCDRNKAFDWAVRELAASNARGHLLIVGDGPERANLARMAADLGVAGRLHLAGGQRDMAPYYAAADCVVSTSFYDTFPNVILEGMVHGRPTIVPRHDPPHVFSGTAEIVGVHGGGCVYDRRQAGTLAACWNGLIADRLRAQRLGQQAQEIAARQFRWDACLDRILAVTSTERRPAVADRAPQEVLGG